MFLNDSKIKFGALHGIDFDVSVSKSNFLRLSKSSKIIASLSVAFIFENLTPSILAKLSISSLRIQKFVFGSLFIKAHKFGLYWYELKEK